MVEQHPETVVPYSQENLRYVMIAALGQGYYGEVWLAVD